MYGFLEIIVTYVINDTVILAEDASLSRSIISRKKVRPQDLVFKRALENWHTVNIAVNV